MGDLELRAEVKRLRQQLVQQSNESEQRVKQLESELAALRLTSQEDQEMLLAQMTEYDKWVQRVSCRAVQACGRRRTRSTNS